MAAAESSVIAPLPFMTQPIPSLTTSSGRLVASTLGTSVQTTICATMRIARTVRGEAAPTTARQPVSLCPGWEMSVTRQSDGDSRDLDHARGGQINGWPLSVTLRFPATIRLSWPASGRHVGGVERILGSMR